MRRLMVVGALAAALLTVVYAAPEPQGTDVPRYNKSGELLRPSNYRDWVFLSSGFGMNYNKGADGMDHPMFTNVFVPQWAYKQFVNTGKWPDKTIFVVEERGVGTDVNPARKGQFQTTEFMGLGVEVKDKRFPENWAYFGFGLSNASAKKVPKENCFQCHEDNAAVEHTFVQFYPTLKPVAERFGVYRKEAEKIKDK